MSELWVCVKFPKHLGSATGQERRLALPSFRKGRWKHGMFSFSLSENYPKEINGCCERLQENGRLHRGIAAVANHLSVHVCHPQGYKPFCKSLTKSVWCQGTWQCWQHRTLVQQIECLVCSPVWMLLNRFFFWKVWRTLEADVMTATQTRCFITGYLKNKRHFIGLSSYDITYMNYLSI